MTKNGRRTTLALEYRFPYGVVNPVWAAYRRFNWLPDHIILFTPDRRGELAAQTRAMLEAFQKSYGASGSVELVEIDSGDFNGILSDAELYIEGAREKGGQVAVDVTAGRTIPKLALYQAAARAQPDHVFYLNVKDYDYRAEPYPLVPKRIQECQDLNMEDVMDHGN